MSGTAVRSEIKSTRETYSIEANDLSNTLNWKFANWDGKEVFVYYDRQLHQIVMYNADFSNLESKIQLQFEGPDKVDLSGFVVLDSTIVCIGPNEINEVNIKGEVVARMRLLDDMAGDVSYVEPSLFFFEGITDHRPANLYPFIKHSLSDSIDVLALSLKDLVTNISYDLVLEELPGYYKELANLKRQLVIYRHFLPYISVVDDLLYVSFPLSGEVCFKNFMGELDWSCLKVKTRTNIRKELNLSFSYDVNSLRKITEGNSHYGPVHYDVYRDRFVRVSWLPKLDDRHRAILSVYNTDFELVEEIELPKEVVPKRLSIRPDGLYFKEIVVREDELSFRVFEY